MFKKLILLLLSFLMIPSLYSTSNSSFSSDNILEVKPPYVPEVTPEKEKSIVKVNIINIPEEGIKIGHFDEHNIQYEYVYDDSSKDYFPLKESSFPERIRHDVLGREGSYKLKLLIKNVETVFSFTMLPTDKIYTVDLIDFDDTLISSQQVKHNDYPIFPIKNPHRHQDNSHRYIFDSWSYTGLIDDNSPKKIKANYTSVSKYKDFVSTKDDVLTKKDDSSFTIYLGRYYKVPIYCSPSIAISSSSKTVIPYDMTDCSQEIVETYKDRLLSSFLQIYNFSYDSNNRFTNFERYEITKDLLTFGRDDDRKVLMLSDDEYVTLSSSSVIDMMNSIANDNSYAKGEYIIPENYNVNGSYYAVNLFMNIDIFINVSYSYDTLNKRYIFTLSEINMSSADHFVDLVYRGLHDTEKRPTGKYKINLMGDNFESLISKEVIL